MLELLRTICRIGGRTEEVTSTEGKKKTVTLSKKTSQSVRESSRTYGKAHLIGSKQVENQKER